MHVCRYEGPGCNIDVNECVRGTSGCAAHAGCTNTNGSFVCACDYGYSGKRSSAVLVTCMLVLAFLRLAHRASTQLSIQRQPLRPFRCITAVSCTCSCESPQPGLTVPPCTRLGAAGMYANDGHPESSAPHVGHCAAPDVWHS